MKYLSLFVFILICLVLMAVTAEAGVFQTVKEWFTWQAIAYILTGILAIGAVGGSIWYRRINAMIRETGQFLTVLSNALDDKQITKDELKNIMAEGKDIISAWRT